MWRLNVANGIEAIFTSPLPILLVRTTILLAGTPNALATSFCGFSKKKNDNLQLNFDNSGWRLPLLSDPEEHIYVRCVEYWPTTVSREDWSNSRLKLQFMT